MSYIFEKKLLTQVLHYQRIFEERLLIYLRKERGSDAIVDRRFRSTFGISSLVCSRVWQLLQNSPTDMKSMTPDHLLWGLLLLKVYSFEVTHSGMTGVDEKTFRKWSHFAIVRIADMHSELVSYVFYYLC